MKKGIIIILIAALHTGCVGGMLYTNITSPRTYRSATTGDIQGKQVVATDVRGEACSYSFLMLVAIGDGGYDAAVKDALGKTNGGTMLYDVRADVKYTAILGPLYMKLCTSVTGNAVK